MRLLGFVFCCILCCLTAQGQGTFRNLDFEQANIPVLAPNQGGYVYITNGMPGWDVSITYQGNQISENGISLGGPAVSIIGPQFDPTFILLGNYSVYVVGEFGRPNPTVSASIWQTGEIPATAKSLFFLASPTIASPPFQVTIGGVNIPVTETGSTSKFEIWAGDVSAFAGQTEQLIFTALPAHGGFLDQITFSPLSIPEPTAVALIATGGLLLMLVNAKRK